nr:MAG TPA: Cag pathogenicity island protein [Caudoviricetes sp.]
MKSYIVDEIETMYKFFQLIHSYENPLSKYLVVGATCI